jgi:hypothetical protein
MRRLIPGTVRTPSWLNTARQRLRFGCQQTCCALYLHSARCVSSQEPRLTAATATAHADEDELWDSVNDDDSVAATAADRILDELVGLEEARDNNAADAEDARTEQPVRSESQPSVPAPKEAPIALRRRRVSLRPVRPALSLRSQKASEPQAGSEADSEMATAVGAALTRALEARNNQNGGSASNASGGIPSASEAAETAVRMALALKAAGDEVPLNTVKLHLDEATQQRLRDVGGGLLRWLRTVPHLFDVSGDGKSMARRGVMSSARMAPPVGYRPQAPGAAYVKELQAASDGWFAELDIDGPVPVVEDFDQDDEKAVNESLKAVKESQSSNFFPNMALPAAPSLSTVLTQEARNLHSPTSGIARSSVTDMYPPARFNSQASSTDTATITLPNLDPKSVPSPPKLKIGSVRTPPPLNPAHRLTPPALPSQLRGSVAASAAVGWRPPSEMLELFVDIVPTYFVSMQLLRMTKELETALGGAHNSLSLPRVLKKYQFYFDVRRAPGSTVLDIKLKDLVAHPRRGAADDVYQWARTDGVGVGSSRPPASLGEYMAANPHQPLLRPIDRSALRAGAEPVSPPMRKWGPGGDPSASPPPVGSTANASSASTFFAEEVLALLQALPCPGTVIDGVPYDTWTAASVATSTSSSGGGERKWTDGDVLRVIKSRADVFLFVSADGTAASPTGQTPFMLRPLLVSPGATAAFGAGDSSPCPPVIAALGRVVPRGIWATVEKVEAKLTPDEKAALAATGRSLVDVARAHGRLLWVSPEGDKVRRFAAEAELDDIVHFSLVLLKDAVTPAVAPAAGGASTATSDRVAAEALKLLPPAVEALLRRDGAAVVKSIVAKHKAVFAVSEAPAADAADEFARFAIGRASAYRGVKVKA